jgi:pyruvate formate lyase activating enzyme
VLDTLGPDVPLHFSRFLANYQLLNLPPTSLEALEAARHMALEAGLHYVYLGNAPGSEGNHTFCPRCGQRIIERAGMTAVAINMVDGACGFCHEPIPGVWK